LTRSVGGRKNLSSKGANFLQDPQQASANRLNRFGLSRVLLISPISSFLWNCDNLIISP
jgi:hypothetical protein